MNELIEALGEGTGLPVPERQLPNPKYLEEAEVPDDWDTPENRSLKSVQENRPKECVEDEEDMRYAKITLLIICIGFVATVLMVLVLA